ncbi:MAG: archaellin/type IV pilin N-terminal domain-containing protein [Candidatus Nanoarchaeia archaeon]
MNVKNKSNKKAVSPVIATVLLVGMVVVIGLIIFLWFRGMVSETITKFDGTNIEIICGDVVFEASYDSALSELSVVNTGSVPIYNLKLKISGAGGYDTEDLGLNGAELNSGGATTADISSYEVVEGNELTLIPVLLGLNEDGEQESFICDEKDGVKIIA